MIQENLEIPAADGVTEALLVRPESTDPLPAIINLTDGLGFRPAFAEQSKRIAEGGYVVLTPNIFYRISRSPVFPFEPDFGDDRTRERFSELKAPLTPVAMERDGSAYVDFLASQPFVGSGPMGVIGFCFAGKFALLVAAALAQDIRNIRSDPGDYPSPLHVEALVFDRGRLVVDGHADFLAEPYAGVKGNVEMAEIELDYFRPMLERSNIVVTRGTFGGKGLIEYAPKFTYVDLQELRLDGLHAEYLYHKPTAAVAWR